jgi:hypothetical protein
MGDFFEIDFLDVESDKSGDAITIRYRIGSETLIHVVDGGFQPTGDSVCEHIDTHYGRPRHIDHVVLTHSDSDHAGGLRTVLERYSVGKLWILRPWTYAGQLKNSFPTVASVDRLVRVLREAYPNIVALEEIALRRNIPMAEPFQGTTIGGFTVMAPSRTRYLNLLLRSECTPDSVVEKRSAATIIATIGRAAARAVAYVRAAWGEESFSPEEVSAENEMSVVQYAAIAGQRILLTADAGREALAEVVQFAPYAGLELPGIDRFQVPHHGSRRNLTSELLDRLVGPRLGSPIPSGNGSFTGIISSAKKDEHHPRKTVVRAIIHRGGNPIATEGKTVCTFQNAPQRPGWGPVQVLEYPTDQETN